MTTTTTFKTQEGRPYPLGSTFVGNGVNFAIFSANAEKVELCLFDEKGEKEIARIRLRENTDQVWHVYVEGLSGGALYGYRVYGPYDPSRGHRFNHHKLLLDPYTRKIFGELTWSDHLYAYDLNSPLKDLAFDTYDNAHLMPKCVVTENIFNQNSTLAANSKPNIPWEKTVIYETHVKGISQLNMKIPENLRGTYAGLAHPETLDYIKSLGVTAIELLPVHGFADEHFLVTKNLTNYWGYNSFLFFSPAAKYSSSGHIFEFKQMVDKIHDHGLEVILDVVYNHTAEGNHLGPTLSLRGIDNASYYMLEAHDHRFYANDTGCGNTLNVSHPRVLQMVMDSLRFWVASMGVDGFRFDLATVMGREAQGFHPGSGFFDSIRQDPILGQCKLIAEPWDIGPGGYQLGNYPSGWSEWNDRYRDTSRRFWRGDRGILPEFARRIHGSSDIFEHSGRSPRSSVNFITSHDGFTLNDVVSYNERHNLDNLESNRDGHHNNLSYNYGVEGVTDKEQINVIREKQKRNFLATLFFSQGTPMLLAGDELGRTQNGNNNSYCQDNEMNWLDWDDFSDADWKLQEFVRYIIQLRNEYPLLSSPFYIHQPDECLLDADAHCQVRWINSTGQEMKEKQWVEQQSHVLGWVLEKVTIPDVDDSSDQQRAEYLLMLFNSSESEVNFVLPEISNLVKWQCLVDTEQHDGIAKNEYIENLKEDHFVILSSRSLQLYSAVF